MREIDPRKLKLLEKNARYMPEAQFAQLVKNVQRDGVLTSMPLVYQGEVISGNHRTMAAIAAGLKLISVIEIESELTEEQKLAIQLSHNALNGKDDTNILRELFDLLPADAKEYAGLHDEDFKDLNLNSLTIDAGGELYREIKRSFLPSNAEAFVKHVAKLAKSKKVQTIYAARLTDFDVLFGAIARTKETQNITNHALALLAMAELASERLDQLEQEKENDDASGQTTQTAATQSP